MEKIKEYLVHLYWAIRLFPMPWQGQNIHTFVGPAGGDEFYCLTCGAKEHDDCEV